MGGKAKYLGVGGEAKTEQKRREKKMGQMLQTLKHTHTHTHIHEGRERYTYIPLASSFVRELVRSSSVPRCGGGPGWLALPPSPACSGTLITRLHGTCAVPCFSRSHPQVPIKINAFCSIHPSVHPARPCSCETQTLTLPS
jgi:hypothetical protein